MASLRIATGFALALASTTPAMPVELPPIGAVRQDNAGDLRALENRLQRQQYQQQQQQLREQDRFSYPLQQPAPRVPVMRPNCQIQVYGTTRACR